MNLYAAFRAGFPADLARNCIETNTGRSVSYADLDDLSGRLAAVLQDRGVTPGERVTVQVDKSPEALALYFACLRLGAIYMPLNSGYTAAELDYFLGDATPVLFVDDPTLETLFDQAGKTRPLAAIADSGEEDVAAMLYTSGTTGRSKGAMLTHGNLLSNARSLVEAWGFTEHDTLLHCLPIFHVHGLFVALGCALLSGAKIIWHAGFEAEAALDAMSGVTVFMGVPTYYTRLLASRRLDRKRTAHMRLFVSGSAPLLPDTYSSFRERTGHSILERYGMTETGMNTSNPLAGERRVGTVGLPLPGVELRIADETGQALPPGETGVIEVRGDGVLKGYWNNPEKTRAAFRADGFFITGDVARQEADGYVTIVGRASDMIISGGYNVYPKEIETVLDTLPGVAESAVIGVPHPDFGEGVVAVIRARQGEKVAPDAEIIAALKAQLAGYKVPKKLIHAAELPRNAMGKVIKAELRKAHSDLFRT